MTSSPGTSGQRPIKIRLVEDKKFEHSFCMLEQKDPIENVILSLKDIADQRGPVPVTGRAMSAQEFTLPCANCGRSMLVSEIPYVSSGIVMCRDGMCRECLPMFTKHSKVVCLGCNRNGRSWVSAKIPPHRDPSGFEFKPGAFLHVHDCPTCNPAVVSSTLIEKAVFDKERKR